MDTLFVILIFLCALGSGLMAGVFFAFSSFVMTALARLAPTEGMRAMQTINVTVLNRLFLSIFMGTGAISIVAIVMAFLRWEDGSMYTLLGGGIYLLGSILVTMRGNVPLNNALAALDAEAPDSARRWSDYVRDWTRWNHVRTVACAAALVLFILAINNAVWIQAWRLLM
ncbi:anthrone oxygenase family protein [Dongia deserti]|uniref:anthrone oxygenase family protein n=1 Tax=Dongia deserti TaxID=2268030 RepID=UPI000E65DF20|nr:anthrone oxygenase family protein [Dongia deserti]